MKHLRNFIGISCFCHAILILALVDIDFSSREIPTYDVYEVSIVSSAPSASTRAASKKAPAVKKYVYHKGSDKAAISSIKRDKSTGHSTPDLKPADIEPVERTQDEPLPDIEPQRVDDLDQGREKYGSAGTFGPKGPTSLSSNPVNIWKSRVRSLVNGFWKTPPEISIMDMSLKTTYLLRISRAGDLLDKRLLVSSGNIPFDRSVLLALSSVTRLPAPPLVLIAGRDAVEITMSFTPPQGAE